MKKLWFKSSLMFANHVVKFLNLVARQPVQGFGHLTLLTYIITFGMCLTLILTALILLVLIKEFLQAFSHAWTK